MMSRFFLYFLSVFMIAGNAASGQGYMTRTARISFEASTPLETIDAVNNQGAGILDLSSGEVIFEVLIKGFRFEKALMQEHFNENYMESDRFPRATFKCRLSEKQLALMKQGGAIDMEVKGMLTMHGVSKALQVPVTLVYQKTLIEVTSNFRVRPEDFQIEIPALVRNKIAKTVDIKLKAEMKER